MAKQFSLVGDDANVEVGHQDENSLAPIGTAHADVVQLAAEAQRDRAPAVDVVTAHSRFGEHRLSTDLNRGLVECTPRALRDSCALGVVASRCDRTRSRQCALMRCPPKVQDGDR